MEVFQHNASTSKTVFRNRAYNKQVRSATKNKEKIEATSKHVNQNWHNSIYSNNNSRLAFQVYSRKNSLTIGNSMNIKRNYGSIGEKNKKKLA